MEEHKMGKSRMNDPLSPEEQFINLLEAVDDSIIHMTHEEIIQELIEQGVDIELEVEITRATIALAIQRHQVGKK